MMRRVVGIGYKYQFEAEWRIDPTPEWYDHLIHQYWFWPLSRNPMSWERGIFSMLPMKNGCRVLDLCCGGGFFAHHFFSSRASSVISVDFDPNAIVHAKANFQAHNVEFRLCDIRTDMPDGTFDNVVWDAAIEHFTEAEAGHVLADIKRRLTDRWNTQRLHYRREGGGKVALASRVRIQVEGGARRGSEEVLCQRDGVRK